MDNYLKGMVEEPKKERRFVITEAYKDGFGWVTATPESELKRRILMLTGGDYREGDIEIIVNGTGGEQPVDNPGFDVTGFYGKPWPGPDDIIKMRGKEQPVLCKHNLELRHCPLCELAPKPDEKPIIINRACPPCCKGNQPKPTRKEWEEWIDRLPHRWQYSSTDLGETEYDNAKKCWFLTMPGVPK